MREGGVGVEGGVRGLHCPPQREGCCRTEPRAPRSLALERRVKAASAVYSFGSWRLSSLLTELLSSHRAAEPRVRRLVLLIEGCCRRNRRRWSEVSFTGLLDASGTAQTSLCFPKFTTFGTGGVVYAVRAHMTGQNCITLHAI